MPLGSSGLGSYTGPMNARSTLALLAACLLPLAAAAQYQWIDKDGRKVFSDRPPPADVPADKVISRPRVAAPVVIETPAAKASGPVIAGSAPKLAGRDKTLEERKKAVEAAEAAKKKAEEEQIAKEREENCARARQTRAALDSGVRMQTTNEKGERVVFGDKERAAEAVKVDAVIARDCKR